MKLLMDKLHDRTDRQKDIKVIKTFVSEKSSEGSPEVEHNQNEDWWLFCQVCSNKCKTKKNIENYQTIKHNNKKKSVRNAVRSFLQKKHLKLMC